MKTIIRFLFLQIVLTFIFAKTLFAYGCGEIYSLSRTASTDGSCSCDAVDNKPKTISADQSYTRYCCGILKGSECRAYMDENIYACGEKSNESSVPDGAICSCIGGKWESYWQSTLFSNRGICCGWTSEDKKQCLSKPPEANDVYCGTAFDPKQKNCVCSNQAGIDENTRCCGWLRDGVCQKTDVAINDVEVTSETLKSLNPINLASGSADLSTPGKIISRALKLFIFPIAGIILFVVLILGGFQMLAGSTNSKSIDEGKQRITAAIIGFILLFAAYWIAQLLELIFSIRILS